MFKSFKNAFFKICTYDTKPLMNDILDYKERIESKINIQDFKDLFKSLTDTKNIYYYVHSKIICNDENSYD